MTTFLATIGQVFTRLLEKNDVDADALLRECGIAPAALRDPEARIPSAASDAGFRMAAARITDPAFALQSSQCWHPSDLGALGYAWLASSTLRTGLHRLERYSRLLGEKAQTRVSSDRDGLRVLFDPNRSDPLVAAMLADFTLALIMGMCRMNYGSELQPVDVRLVRAKPENTEAYRNLYGGRIRFGADDNSFLLAPSVVDAALPTENLKLAATLDDILAAQIATLDKDNIAARCKLYLIEQFTSGELTVDGMAGQLHLSRRTLQRKLSEAETSYDQLVEDTRRELALRYLDEGHKSVSEVTFLLGFSGQSAFARAFKRWTGVSPTAYREQKQSLSA